ncbi:MAG: hypothetical protein KUG78_21180 [Kangiellaceae bacterium]|nr:hypothetical protein [Kangiellaceae bacterium]
MKLASQNVASTRYKIKVDSQNDYAVIRFLGGVTLELANSAFLDLLDHRSFRQNMDACYDFTGAIIEMDMKELEQHAEFVAQHLHQRGSHYKLAMVTDETLNSALLSVYKLLISKTSVDAEVFGSTKQSLVWLNSKD